MPSLELLGQLMCTGGGATGLLRFARMSRYLVVRRCVPSHTGAAVLVEKRGSWCQSVERFSKWSCTHLFVARPGGGCFATLESIFCMFLPPTNPLFKQTLARPCYYIPCADYTKDTAELEETEMRHFTVSLAVPIVASRTRLINCPLYFT